MATNNMIAPKCCTVDDNPAATDSSADFIDLPTQHPDALVVRLAQRMEVRLLNEQRYGVARKSSYLKFRSQHPALGR